MIINNNIIAKYKKAAEAAFLTSLLLVNLTPKLMTVAARAVFVKSISANYYQILTRFSGAIYIASPSLTSKVL